MARNADRRLLVKQLELRLNQARRVAQAAKVCLKENKADRVVDFLEEAQALVRESEHLVSAAVILSYPEPERQEATAADQASR